jgi:hypothetical protein
MSPQCGRCREPSVGVTEAPILVESACGRRQQLLPSLQTKTRAPSTRRHVNCSTITINPACRFCGRCKPSSAAADEPSFGADRPIRCSTRCVHRYIPTCRRCAAPLAIEPIVVEAFDADTIVATEHLTIMPHGHQQYQHYHLLLWSMMIPSTPLRSLDSAFLVQSSHPLRRRALVGHGMC